MSTSKTYWHLCPAPSYDERSLNYADRKLKRSEQWDSISKTKILRELTLMAILALTERHPYGSMGDDTTCEYNWTSSTSLKTEQ